MNWSTKIHKKIKDFFTFLKWNKPKSFDLYLTYDEEFKEFLFRINVIIAYSPADKNIIDIE